MIRDYFPNQRISLIHLKVPAPHHHEDPRFYIQPPHCQQKVLVTKNALQWKGQPIHRPDFQLDVSWIFFYESETVRWLILSDIISQFRRAFVNVSPNNLHVSHTMDFSRIFTFLPTRLSVSVYSPQLAWVLEGFSMQRNWRHQSLAATNGAFPSDNLVTGLMRGCYGLVVARDWVYAIIFADEV